jgi:GNAT superfamily N-acetyltransferase
MEEQALEKLNAHEVRYFAMVAAAEKTPVAWFLHSPELPDYWDANHALHLRDDGRGPEAIVREIVAYYRARGLRPVADVDLIAEAQGIGFALRRRGVLPVIGDTLLMRYPRAERPVLPERGVEVRVVPNETGAGEARLWVETAMCEAEGEEDTPMWLRVAEYEARLPDTECRLYLGLRDGRPAGVCDLFFADGWGRIESVVTRPEWRRHGVASALVARAVGDSLAMGNAVTYLFAEAGGAGEQVYRRLGFVPWALNPLRRHLA